MVSIIVVSYNQSAYIEECLNSIHHQSYTDWELILADDFSSDNSVEVFDNWLEKNNVAAKKNYHTQNKGLCATLNECIDLAEGDYVKFLAADDYLHPLFFEKVVQRFSTLDDTYRLVFTNAFTVNGKSEITDESYLKEPAPTGYVFEKLLAYNFIPALTAVMPRKIFDELGKFDTEILVEDWEYWLRIAKKYQVDCIDEPLAYYRMHDSNITRNKKKMIIACWQILMKHASERKYRKIINQFAVYNLYNKSLEGRGADFYREYPYKSLFILNALKLRPTRALLKQLIKKGDWYK